MLGVAAGVGLVLFVVVARATDVSSFCKSCHEMAPFYDAWTQGPHKSDAQCVDCHVGQGVVPRLAHKFVALGEVVAHVTGNYAFPMPAPAPVPNARCTACHQKVTVKGAASSFSHEVHAEKMLCEQCHATTGHKVTAEALQAAGVYSPRNAAMRAASAKGAASGAPGAGKANVPGHVPVACSQCHDMAATGCPACHKAPHEARGDCAQCHRPGARFAFKHPSTDMEGWQKIACKKCHPVSYQAVNCTCHGGSAPKGD